MGHYQLIVLGLIFCFVAVTGSDSGSDPGGGLRGLKPPPPLQVNEMRNIHFGQNTNSHLSETSEK